MSGIINDRTVILEVGARQAIRSRGIYGPTRHLDRLPIFKCRSANAHPSTILAQAPKVRTATTTGPTGPEKGFPSGKPGRETEGAEGPQHPPEPQGRRDDRDRRYLRPVPRGHAPRCLRDHRRPRGGSPNHARLGGNRSEGEAPKAASSSAPKRVVLKITPRKV